MLCLFPIFMLGVKSQYVIGRMRIICIGSVLPQHTLFMVLCISASGLLMELWFVGNFFSKALLAIFCYIVVTNCL